MSMMFLISSSETGSFADGGIAWPVEFDEVGESLGASAVRRNGEVHAKVRRLRK
jgi:hypothetical protein